MFQFGRKKYRRYRNGGFRGNSKVTFWEECQKSKGKQTIGERKPSQLDPLDKEWIVMRCHLCDSSKHLASRYPYQMSSGHAEPSANNKETMFTMFTWCTRFISLCCPLNPMILGLPLLENHLEREC